MADKKVVFIAFAIEDESQRNLMKGQSLNTRTSFEYIDMSVKEAYDSDWETKVLTRIRRSDGVILLISRNSVSSSGQKKEFQMAKAEGKRILALRAYNGDTTVPAFLGTTPVVAWTWETIARFIDSL
ncbi:MAG TPA: TIR domain-containing protein [Hymenobacter sp.]|jgi:hypothetical protein